MACGVYQSMYGLSPRLRGNRLQGRARGQGVGSIPALTGKPATVRHFDPPSRVYPRAYGETSAQGWRGWVLRGLSPRLRGNLLKSSFGSPSHRSIPALTGKPARPRDRGLAAQVYPRAYGETSGGPGASTTTTGLSPRLRGNRELLVAGNGEPRSIPALTGKPEYHRRIEAIERVYPRAYGETLACRHSLPQERGLSPRLRGNRLQGRARGQGVGSIPALTGKPEMHVFRYWKRWVYPRAYGETLGGVNTVEKLNGLSPRLRGNPARAISATSAARSIPALTGKPDAIFGYGYPNGVYPRAYGETTVGGW